MNDNLLYVIKYPGQFKLFFDIVKKNIRGFQYPVHVCIGSSFKQEETTCSSLMDKNILNILLTDGKFKRTYENPEELLFIKKEWNWTSYFPCIEQKTIKKVAEYLLKKKTINAL